METKELFKNIYMSELEVKNYIAKYFKNFVGYFTKPEEINYKLIRLENLEMYIVILKDDIRRIDVKNGGSGVLRQRQWSVFVFNFIESDQYVKYFGKNKDKKDILSPYKNGNLSEFFYESGSNIYSGKNPDNIYVNQKIKYLLQNYIFHKLFDEYRYLFLNTYVYSIIGVVNSNAKQIEEKNFWTYYYNTSHNFRQVPNKRVINQKYDINKTSYLIDEIEEELSIIEKKYNEMADLINAFTGNLPMNPITSLNYECIKNGVSKGENFIVVEGMARTGKTVIAMRILSDFSAAKLVIMNQHFYKALKESFAVERLPFPSNRIACHTEFDKVNQMFESSEILVVDEAQRLSENQIDNIVLKNQNNINLFLGDNLQKINKKYDKGISVIKKKITEKGNYYTQLYFDYSIGLSSNVLYSIKYLLFNNIPLGSQNINNYEINLFNNVNDFTSKYNNDSTFKKHMATIYMGFNDYNTTIEGFSRWHKDKLSTYHYYLDKDVKESVMLTTYEVISRELDSIYIYLPETVYADENGLHYLHEGNDEYLLNQIYVLMTRAKGCINVFCENISAYNYLCSRYNNILLIDQAEKNNLSADEKEKAQKLADIIEERGITRLIHFTSVDNIDSILKYGIMSVKDMNEFGIKHDFNDTDRLDYVLDGISLSIQNPNSCLLKKFKEKYPNKKFVILVLDPALLYEITDNSKTKLASRIYCDYNAAAKITKKNTENIEIMFPESFVNKTWKNTRINKDDDEPTSEQAEILFRETINPKYILEIKEEE